MQIYNQIDENIYTGKNFVASFSTGKDSTLAIYRAIKDNIIPQELITTYNTERKKSWFHGVPWNLLLNVSKSLNIPIKLIKTKGGDDYSLNFENTLAEAKENGAHLCIFGDIDLEAHLKWCTDRCLKAGLKAYFPLWQENREKLVYEFIDSGFKAVINVVNTTYLPERFLGKILTKEVAEEIKAHGADMCGENGEYHTFVFDGPIFQYPVNYRSGEMIKYNQYVILPLK